MANPSTATPTPASAVVEEAVRIVAESSRRYLVQANQFNRDLFGLWTTSTQIGLQTAFDLQKAAFASSQAFIEKLTAE